MIDFKIISEDFIASLLRVVDKDASKRFHTAMSRAHRESTRAFLDAMVDNMLTDTGMSKASLLPLAAKVRHKTALLAKINGKRGPRVRANAPTGKFADNSKYVSITQGIRVGKRAFTYDIGTPEKPIMTLTFEIAVLQHFLWEVGFDGGAAKTNSLAAGVAAYKRTFLPALQRLRPSFSL